MVAIVIVIVVVMVFLIVAVVLVEGLLLVEDAALFGALLLHKLVVHRPFLPRHLLLLLPIQLQHHSFRLRRRCARVLKGDGRRHAPARRWCCCASASPAAAHASIANRKSQSIVNPRAFGPVRSLAFYLSFLYILFPAFPGLPNPDPAPIQSFHPARTSSPPATIPAFPEQSDLAGCPLDLPNELFHGIKSACSATKGDSSDHLQRSRCCPALAAWLYSAYSATALGRVGRVSPAVAGQPYDLPLLPDDSETCVEDLGQALKTRGIDLIKPNETCDVVYCYCGIRLHPLSCPEAFWENERGKLVGGAKVKKLERDCLSGGNNGFPGLGGCSKCLHSLYNLNKKKASNSSKLGDRTTKMHNKDCQLMGLTWLLAKNRTAYIHTVTSVFRAFMVSTDGSDPRSCTLNSDGMPLAVDSSQISEQSSSNILAASVFFYIVMSLSLLFMLQLTLSSIQN